MTSHFNLEQLVSKLAFMQTRVDEVPDSLSNDEWKQYVHLKNQVKSIQRQEAKGQQSRRIKYQHIRKYNDGMCWYGGYEGKR